LLKPATDLASVRGEKGKPLLPPNALADLVDQGV
jgi:hypothetical protein